MADLHIIGSVPIKISLDSVIDPTFIGTDIAVVDFVPIKISVAGVITLATPGVEAIVGSVALEVSPAGVIAFAVPPVLDVVGSVGLAITPAGVISEPVPRVYIGSVKLGIGVRGEIGSGLPVTSPILSVIGSVGLGINATGVVALAVPSVLSVIGSVEIRINEFRVPELTVVQLIPPSVLVLVAITGSVGIEVGTAGVIALATPLTYAVPPPRPIEGATINIKVAGIIAFISPQILEIIGDIEVGISGGEIDPGVFDTYALTGARGEPSIYSGFNFNSYARHRGQDFGAGAGGIYLLVGEDDAGDEIHPGLKIGPFNLATDREKRLRLLRLGGKTDGAQVKVSNGNGGAGYYPVEEGRVAVSREVQGREITIEITDFESLDHLEIIQTILHKR